MPKIDSIFTFRDVDLARYYDRSYAQNGSPLASRSQAAKRDLQRYQWLIQSSLPKFSEQEAIAIWAELNGVSTRETEMLLVTQQGIAFGLEQPLQDKVLGLSPCKWVAVVDACDRAGCGGYYIKNLVSELKKVGIC